MKAISLEIQTDLEGQVSELGRLIENQFSVVKTKTGFAAQIRGEIHFDCKTGKNTLTLTPAQAKRK